MSHEDFENEFELFQRKRLNKTSTHGRCQRSDTRTARPARPWVGKPWVQDWTRSGQHPSARAGLWSFFIAERFGFFSQKREAIKKDHKTLRGRGI